MGWKNCRPKSSDENELRKIICPERNLAIDVVSSPLPMLLCSGHRGAAIDIEEARRERLEPPQRSIEQPHRAAQRASLGVVIRGGELDESLIELDEIALRFEPQRLPRL